MNRKTENVIPFRRAKPPALRAGDEPPLSSPATHPFVQLGVPVDAVILRLRDRSTRIKVRSQSREEE